MRGGFYRIRVAVRRGRENKYPLLTAFKSVEIAGEPRLRCAYATNEASAKFVKCGTVERAAEKIGGGGNG